MGGKGSPPPPPQIDPGASMGEYLFGQNFGQFQGITDPVLQQRILDAERTFRPQYTALELADIGTMARGIEAGAVNPEYQRLEAELSGLQAAQEAGGASRTQQELEDAANTLFPDREVPRGRSKVSGEITAFNESQQAKRDAYISAAGDPGQDRVARISQIQEQLQGMSPTLEETPGLFGLLEESSQRAFDLQQDQLLQQRAADVKALQDFAPDVVQAYRAADPASTAIAERMSRRALGQLTPEEERNIQQRSRQASLSRGRIGDSSSVAAEALGRSDYTAQFAQPAFAMNRALAGDIGSTLLGRPSAAIGLGGQILGQAQQGAAGTMGPQLFDPNVGINMALQQRGQDVTFQGMQAQANAARTAGLLGAVGSIGAAAAMPTPVTLCWVAREVYGIENPKWLQFRYWMLNDAPSWFRSLYIKYGERIAKFISNKPRIKSIIRQWMNTKIK
tara:strand:+ start:862 stop:2211 length:1350 start_codon:yes stop_codon:yes gene_type:complete